LEQSRELTFSISLCQTRPRPKLPYFFLFLLPCLAFFKALLEGAGLLSMKKEKMERVGFEQASFH
jgi:hypothetical protein